jgi:two-component system chemotaxis response regulator CheY
MNKILIVDDSEMARASMSFSLKSKRYGVVEAVNGKDALVKLSEHQDIGLVITDLNMPEMDGVALIQKVRQSDRNKDLPIYVITTEQKTGEEVIKKGATGVIIKSGKTSEEIHKIVSQYVSPTE